MFTILVTIGCLFALLGVVLGAFGAHALRGKLTSEQLSTFQTGVQYQMYHAFGLIALGITSRIVGTNGLLYWAGMLMILGVLLFSGSLYALTMTGKRAFGAITPLGGVSWIIAWALFAAAGIHP